MLSIKDSTLMLDSDQAERVDYHFEEMLFEVEQMRRSLQDSQQQLSRFLRHLTDLKEITHASK